MPSQFTTDGDHTYKHNADSRALGTHAWMENSVSNINTFYNESTSLQAMWLSKSPTYDHVHLYWLN